MDNKLLQIKVTRIKSHSKLAYNMLFYSGILLSRFLENLLTLIVSTNIERSLGLLTMDREYAIHKNTSQRKGILLKWPLIAVTTHW